MEKAQQYEKCKCCGKNTLSADSLFDICENCGWQDDAVYKSDYIGIPDHAQLIVEIEN